MPNTEIISELPNLIQQLCLSVPILGSIPILQGDRDSYSPGEWAVDPSELSHDLRLFITTRLKS